MSVEEFVKLFNSERKAHSGNWFYVNGNVCGTQASEYNCYQC